MAPVMVLVTVVVTVVETVGETVLLVFDEEWTQLISREFSQRLYRLPQRQATYNISK